MGCNGNHIRVSPGSGKVFCLICGKLLAKPREEHDFSSEEAEDEDQEDEE